MIQNHEMQVRLLPGVPDMKEMISYLERHPNVGIPVMMCVLFLIMAVAIKIVTG